MRKMQEFTYLKGSEEFTLDLPDPETELLKGVHWGHPCALFTPAYWYTQYAMCGQKTAQDRHRIGNNFAEEVAVCLLGGFGIPAEVGNAAFARLKKEGLIDTLCDNSEKIERALYEPLSVGNRWIRYRFWRQKAKYLASAFRHLRSEKLPLEQPLQLRSVLLTWPGVGPKTASWIVRNWLNSDQVAILDIHIVRAGLLMNLYSPSEKVETQYRQMEEKFLALSAGLAVPTSDLDALIWSRMRTTPHLVAKLLQNLRLRSQIAPTLQVAQGRMGVT
jgi:N-glycosylase/DNA lyase